MWLYLALFCLHKMYVYQFGNNIFVIRVILILFYLITTCSKIDFIILKYRISVICMTHMNQHCAQVNIRGYGVVLTGNTEFEARKRRNIDLISFDMVNKLFNCQIRINHGTQSYLFLLLLVSHLEIQFRSAWTLQQYLITLCRWTDLLAEWWKKITIF